MANDILRSNYSAVPDRMKINYMPILAVSFALSAVFAGTTSWVYHRIDGPEIENCRKLPNSNDVASCVERVENETQRKIGSAQEIFIPATLLSASALAAYGWYSRKK